MLKLDHLTIIAPSLEAGAVHVREQLGIAMPVGGKHPEMGTHYLLLGLSDDVVNGPEGADQNLVRSSAFGWLKRDASL